MKSIIVIATFIFISVNIFSQRGTINVVKNKPETTDTIPKKQSYTYVLHYFEGSTSLGWAKPKKITGFNVRYGRQFPISSSFNLRLGIDYENYIISNSYFKGNTIGYFLKTEILNISRSPFLWIPLSFTHKFGLENKLYLGVENYNEFLIGTGIGISFRDIYEIEINIDLRKPKAFKNRNTFITPSIHFVYILVREK